MFAVGHIYRFLLKSLDFFELTNETIWVFNMLFSFPILQLHLDRSKMWPRMEFFFMLWKVALCSLKTENPLFSDVFRGYRSRILVENGWMIFVFFISCNKKENIHNFTNVFFSAFLNAVQQLILLEIKTLLIFDDFVGILSNIFNVVYDKKRY